MWTMRRNSTPVSGRNFIICRWSELMCTGVPIKKYLRHKLLVLEMSSFYTLGTISIHSIRNKDYFKYPHKPKSNGVISEEQTGHCFIFLDTFGVLRHPNETRNDLIQLQILHNVLYERSSCTYFFCLKIILYIYINTPAIYCLLRSGHIIRIILIGLWKIPF